MKRVAMFAGSLVLLLSAAPLFAQPSAPGAARPPAAAPPPAAAQPPAPASVAQPPAPFPQGAKIGFVNLQVIAQNTADGKAAATKVTTLAQAKQAEAANRAKTLQTNQQKLQSGGGVLTDAARALLEKDIATQQRDSDRFEQDAQAEINELQQQLQNEFQKKLFPIIEEIRRDKELWMIVSLADAGVIVWDPGLDFTVEAVKRMDAKK